MVDSAANDPARLLALDSQRLDESTDQLQILSPTLVSGFCLYLGKSHRK